MHVQGFIGLDAHAILRKWAFVHNFGLRHCEKTHFKLTDMSQVFKGHGKLIADFGIVNVL